MISSEYRSVPVRCARIARDASTPISMTKFSHCCAVLVPCTQVRLRCNPHGKRNRKALPAIAFVDPKIHLRSICACILPYALDHTVNLLLFQDESMQRSKWAFSQRARLMYTIHLEVTLSRRSAHSLLDATGLLPGEDGSVVSTDNTSAGYRPLCSHRIA